MVLGSEDATSQLLSFVFVAMLFEGVALLV